MRKRIVVAGVASLFLIGSAGLAQTPEIQKQVEKKLEQLKKEQASLEDLMAQALKNNADIRIAEAKLREAEAQLYRARVTVLNGIVMLTHEIGSAKAAAKEANSRYVRDKELFSRGGLSAAELSASEAAMEKYKADVEIHKAKLDLLIGKHNEKAAKQLMGVQGGLELVPIEDWLSTKPLRGTEFVVPVPVQSSMADKIRKALDTPFKPGSALAEISERDLLDLLREHVKGVNIQAALRPADGLMPFQIKDSIPVGALFQWAEDQVGWRFVIREYGIVATDRKNVPPGALLLMDFWRQGKDDGAP
jgi:hypothetical protein